MHETTEVNFIFKVEAKTHNTEFTVYHLHYCLHVAFKNCNSHKKIADANRIVYI